VRLWVFANARYDSIRLALLTVRVGRLGEEDWR